MTRIKTGGRKGAPNKRTVEMAERARIDIENAKGAGKKLGKEVLEEFMHLFAGMAGRYQPLPDGMPVPPGRQPDEQRFLVYAKLTVDTAKVVAEFQSPKFKAIAIVNSPGEGMAPPSLSDRSAEVFQIRDARILERIYRTRIKQIA